MVAHLIEDKGISMRYCKLLSGIKVDPADGVIPLHEAIRMADPACVDILLKYGASKDVEDERGTTCLQVAW